MKGANLEGLISLGLTQKEAAVYLALLQTKKGTALTVAKQANIKRPTVYLVLNSLIKKGLVKSTKYRDVLDYRALPLEHRAGWLANS
jgi:sugar-specific transcriptional regulator TrmB